MATWNAPLPDPLTNVDGPDILPPIEPPMPEDLGEGVPLGEDDPEERERAEIIRDRF